MTRTFALAAIFASTSFAQAPAVPLHPVLVTLGASITAGINVPSGSDWSSRLTARLALAGLSVKVINKGISGNRLLSDGSGKSALARFGEDILAIPDVRWVIFSDDPLNDIGMASRSSSTKRLDVKPLVDALRQLSDRAHSRGIKFFCSTLTPFKGSYYWSVEGESTRQAYNSFVRNRESRVCDAIIDQDAATHDPNEPVRLKVDFDSGDHLHLNASGQSAIADAIDIRPFHDSR